MIFLCVFIESRASANIKVPESESTFVFEISHFLAAAAYGRLAIDNYLLYTLTHEDSIPDCAMLCYAIAKKQAVYPSISVSQ